MDVKMVSREEAQKVIDKQPSFTKKGKWTTLCAEVKATGQAAQVTGLKRGQCYALRRAAKDAGLFVQTIDRGTGVVILPPKVPKGVK